MVKTEKLMIITPDDVEIEAEFFQSNSINNYAILITHPHPEFGGNMRNNVVTGVFNKLINEDISSLRFNFRAVGISTGKHGNGEEERIDV